jgi:hypothetical protein
MTGILLIAVGHKNYTRMASMLAMSIKANGVELPICLATDNEQVDEHYSQYFDSIIDVPEHCLEWRGNTCYIKAKAHMDELTPFEYTLFLDSDIILVNNGMINEFIDSLKSVDFTVKNSGFKNYGDVIDENEVQWANLLEVKEAYGFINEPIWNVHSEFIWWKKGHKIFKQWVENFENLKVTPIDFAGCVPDELPLWIAMAQLNIAPHKSPFRPVFWPMDKDGGMLLSELKKEYCGVSIGGSFIGGQQKDNYDNLCKIYQRMLHLPYIYLAQPKRRWLPERKVY